MRFKRCKTLFGDDFDKLQNAKILILGVGGVGGYCLDCLYRSGLKDITIVDYDSFEESNQNRQIGAKNLKEIKVFVLQRLYDGIKAIEKKIDKEWCEEFDFAKYDIVIDAIDDMKAKVAIANSVKTTLISSAGSAKRVDPTKIKVASIWKSYGDKLAKKFRYELKKSGFNGDFLVVFSDEEPKCSELGSFVGVTGSFGLTLCSLAISKIIEE